jgi:hypothetical protein
MLTIMRIRHFRTVGFGSFLLAAAFLASGCSATVDVAASSPGAIVETPDIAKAVAALANELSTIDGFGADGVEYRTLVGDDGPQLHVSGWANDLAGETTMRALTVVRDAMEQDAFEGLPVLFYVEAELDETLLIDVSDFAAPDVLENVAYWRSLREIAGGVVSLWIEDAEHAAPGELERGISAENASDLDWAAIRSLPAPIVAEPFWSFPGVSATGELPTSLEVQLLDDLAVQVPKYDAESTSGVLLQAQPGDAVAVSITNPGIYQDAGIARTEFWPGVLTSIRIVGAAKAKVVGLQYSAGYPDAGGSIHFGSCGAPLDEAPGDRLFFDELRAEGVPLADATPGGCETV